MNKWLAGLLLAGILLPLLMFLGNYKVEVEPEHSVEAEAQLMPPEGNFPEAPEITGIHEWLNSRPLNISGLRGKVVLVDFWTYSCINCIRTIPYLNSWHEKYADNGLVIIGVHTPEFDFEKKPENVKMAIGKYGIDYPVAMDNDFATWRAYKNSYWPRKYLIDAYGRVRYDHIGEGAYDQTEKVIQDLLRERGTKVAEEMAVPKEAVSVDYGSIATPEIYFGYEYARVNLGSPEGFRPEETVKYSVPAGELAPSIAYVEGEWKNLPDSLELASDEGRVLLKYTAKAVNAVAGPGNASTMGVAVDGIPVNSSNSGSDVKKGLVSVREQRLYSIVMDSEYSTKVVEVSAKGKGFRIYTFTFG